MGGRETWRRARRRGLKSRRSGRTSKSASESEGSTTTLGNTYFPVPHLESPFPSKTTRNDFDETPRRRVPSVNALPGLLLDTAGDCGGFPKSA